MKKKIISGISIISVLAAVLIYGETKGWFGGNTSDYKVEITKIERLNITETVVATGKIQPEIEVKLSSEVSGEIIELPIKEGDQVVKGDLLLRINPDIIQSGVNRSEATLQNVRASLRQAEASLKETKYAYDRNQGLFDKGVISKAEWDRSVSAYEVAEASKESAYYGVLSAQATVNESRDNLARTVIYAPMDGTISKLSVELGERVVGTQQMAGTEVLRVANLNTMEVEIDVNENDIVKITKGDTALVAVDAYLKEEFKGIVTEIANSADSVLSSDQVTNFKVKVRILKSSYASLLKGKPEFYSPFRPGMTATVDIITARKMNSIGVPISAIVIKKDTSAVSNEPNANTEKQYECVFVKEGALAAIRVVKTGVQDDAYIEITEGLSEGDEVISGPYKLVTKTLNPGDAVTVESEE